MKIQYALLPLLFAPMIAVAQIAPQPAMQQPPTAQDQAWAAAVAAINGVESGVGSLKFAITQYQDRMIAVVRSQADQLTGLQTQAQGKDAYWKAYVTGSDEQIKALTDQLAPSSAHSTPKP